MVKDVNKSFIAIFITINTITGTLGWRPFSVLISNQTSTSLSWKIVTNSSVDDGKLNYYLDVRKTLPNLYMHTLIVFEYTKGKYDLVLLNRTVSMCKLYANKRYEPIMQISLRVLKNFGVMPSKCPISKGIYYLNNLTVETDKLPPVFPERNGYVVMTYYENLNGDLKSLSKMETFFAIEKTYKEI